MQNLRRSGFQLGLLRSGIAVALTTLSAWAQQSNPAAVAESSAAPLTVTLQDALARARAYEPQSRAALTDYGVARQNAVQARAALLPTVSYDGQFLYNQGNGTSTGRYIGANGVHEYISEGNVHQALSLQNAAEFRRSQAQAALAKAKSEIAARGLVVTVVQAYYGLVVAQRKFATAQRATGESGHFLDITQKLEHGGEVAHSDSIKAQLQQQQQQRALQDAELEMERSRLDLAVLIFPTFNENFATVDDLDNPEPLPSYEEVEVAAGNSNPQLRVAVASLHAANQEVAVAWNSFLPSLGVDYFYGIDANHYAVNGIDPATGRNVKNLGYAATATVQLPLWNWGASRSKVRQADLQRDQAKVELSFAQRKAAADLKLFYNEAQTSRSELESLRQSAELASESLRLTNLRYQAGEATVLEVVDAQNTLTLAQNAWGDGQLRFRLALANLQTLTGQF